MSFVRELRKAYAEPGPIELAEKECLPFTSANITKVILKEAGFAARLMFMPIILIYRKLRYGTYSRPCS